MKTNLKRLSGIVLSVGMISSLSLTAFGMDEMMAIPLTASNKVQAVEISKISKGALSTQNLGENIAITVSTNSMEPNAVKAFEIKDMGNGNWQYIDKNTGEKFVSITKAENAKVIK